jgi:hypothetical protein
LIWLHRPLVSYWCRPTRRAWTTGVVDYGEVRPLRVYDQ